MKLLIFILLLGLLTNSCFSQGNSYPLDKWAEMLRVKNDYKQLAYREVVTALLKAPGESFYPILGELDKMAGPSDKRFHIRIKLLRANLIYLNSGWRNVSRNEKVNQVIKLLRRALLEAYQAGDEMLVAQVSDYYGRTMYNEKMTAPGVMHCLNAIEIQNKLGVDKFAYSEYLRYIFGILLYRTREYSKAIYYTKKAIGLNLGKMGNFYLMNAWNTLGLAYSKKGEPDSAFIAFGTSMKLANTDSNFLWKGIISGNIAHVLFSQKKFDSAKILLEYEFEQSTQGKLMDNAANALQWQARTNLRLGKKEIALGQLHQAYHILSKHPQGNQADYLSNIYRTYAEVYQALDQMDSSYFYLQLFTHLQDSLDNIVAASKTEIAGIRLANQNSIYKIQSIKRQKKAEQNSRNLIIGGLLMTFIILLLLLNRQRLKFKHKQHSNLQQKLLVESEMQSAKQQLSLFTKSLKEKTALIQELQAQIKIKTVNIEQQRLTEALIGQAILTEDDWQNFKALYEKIYPGFFIGMKQEAPDITSAELRFAALSRLHLTSKEIASILGISVGSVYKSRQRLRQRLHLSTQDNVEEYIALISPKI